MALCAGYVSAAGKWNAALLRSTVLSFERASTVTPAEIRVIETAQGHHIASWHADAVSQPTVHQDDKGNSLMLLGFVRPPAGCSIFDCTVREGGSILETLEGQFVAIFNDAASGAVHIVNDRFSSRPFYLLRTGKGIYYSSSLSFLFQLAGSSADPDPIGWLQIFAYGHTLGARTNRSDAVRLKPGSHVTLSASRIEERQYWRLQHEPTQLNPETHADATFEAFQESAAWRARRYPCSMVALSGGLDSRLLAGALPRDAGAHAFTLLMSADQQENLEVKTATQVAKRLGLPHEVRTINIGNYSRVVDDVVRLSDGLLPMHHPAKTMHFLERLADGEGYLMGGGPGDSLAGAFVPSAEYLDPLRSDELGSRLLIRQSAGAADLPHIFSRDCLEQNRRAIRETFIETWTSLPGPTPAHRATAWAMTVRQPAFTFTTPIHNHSRFEEGTPHLGYRYSDLMLKIPADWLYEKNFYKYMIHRCIPELRDVVYANTGQLLKAELNRYTVPAWHPYRDSFKRNLRKPFSLARRVTRSFGIGRTGKPEPDFDFAVLSGDTKLVNEVEGLLDLRNFPSFMDRDRCRTFIRDFRQGRVRTSPGSDAHLFGCLAAACFTAKQDAASVRQS